ncbi:hemicentin-2-like isoform X1 [Acanthopagrus latus]|uniref:hemicentin-2-like isoform X1 n=1 Tax=Acanthopagrus latus TaxID=8177 RepID=UPI00187CBBF4|nr:hemicentin-2-like isoform X1 [Acanthopagrus latus]
MWLFIVCVFMAWPGKAVSSSCSVELNPPKAVVRFGGPFFANCSSTSDHIEGMGWESSNEGVPNTAGVSSLVLNVTSVTDWQFNPQCFVNVATDQCFKYLPVTLYKMPDTVSISDLSKLVPLTEGRKYLIECDISNVAPIKNLSVTWFKGKDIIDTQTYKSGDPSASTPMNKTSVFELKASSDYDGTQIWCEAELNFGSAASNPPPARSKAQELTVRYRPVFIRQHETVELTAGSRFTLNCTAKANPKPTYRWYVPDSVQKANEDQSMNQPVLSPSLQVPGSYNCTATNKLGTTTKSFTVIEVKRDRTIFAALLGVFLVVAAVLFIAGFFLVKPDGSFSCSKGSYQRGVATSSGPV